MSAERERALDLEAIENRIKAADEMVTALNRPRHTAGARDWLMSIPARPDHDPDLVIAAALGDAYKMLAALRSSEPPGERRIEGWQPIDTVPKDGTRVQLMYEGAWPRMTEPTHWRPLPPVTLPERAEP